MKSKPYVKQMTLSKVFIMDPTGIIVNYHIAYTKEVLVDVPKVTSRRDASKLIGKRAIWKDEKGREYIGKVSGLHGRSGTLRVKFRKPLPANALAKPIQIAE